MISDEVKSNILGMTRGELLTEYKRAQDFVRYGCGSVELKYAYAEYRDMLEKRLHEFTTSKPFDGEGLVKFYDCLGRVVEIAFLRSNNACTIEFIEPSEPSRSNERIVTWWSGQKYHAWEEDGKTKFIQEA